MMKLEFSFHVNEEILDKINSFKFTLFIFDTELCIYSYYFYILWRDKVKKNSILFDVQRTIECKETNLSMTHRWRQYDVNKYIAISPMLNLFNYTFRSLEVRIVSINR